MGATVGAMALPEHWQRSSDRRVLTWLGAMAAMTAGAIWVRRMRAPRR